MEDSVELIRLCTPGSPLYCLTALLSLHNLIIRSELVEMQIFWGIATVNVGMRARQKEFHSFPILLSKIVFVLFYQTKNFHVVRRSYFLSCILQH